MNIHRYITLRSAVLLLVIATPLVQVRTFADDNAAAFPLSECSLFDNSMFMRQEHTNALYSLMESGFFVAPQIDLYTSFITSWVSIHPKATVIPVSEMKLMRDLKLMQVYVWIQDGKECLNIDLVRNGYCPAGVMSMSTDFVSETEKEGVFKRFVPEVKINAFIREVDKAEAEARHKKRGIWGYIGSEIQDSARLLKQCRQMIGGLQTNSFELIHRDDYVAEDRRTRFEGAILPSLWPDSVCDLNPLALFVFSNRISIVMTTGGIGPSRGYMIYANSPIFLSDTIHTNDMYLSPTKYHDIFMWTGSD